MKKAVIFDMDGLIIDSERVTWEGYEKQCKALGYTMTYEFYLSMVGNPMSVVRKMLKEHFGDNFPMEQIIHTIHEDMDCEFRECGVPVKKGLKEILCYCKAKGLFTLVATSSDRNRVERILEYAGVKEYFTDIICGNEVINGKPAPDIFLKGCQMLGVQPQKAFVLEDSELGVLAAHRAGIDVICVPDLKKPGKEFKELALAVVDSLVEAKDIIEGLVG